MNAEELEVMTEYNLRDIAYYEEEAERLSEAAAQGKHNGEGQEVEDEHSD